MNLLQENKKGANATGKRDKVTGALIESGQRGTGPMDKLLTQTRFTDPLEFVERVAGRFHYMDTVPVVLYSAAENWKKEKHVLVKSD